MGVFHKIQAIFARLTASRRLSDFSCGDCDRNEQCGLPPHDKCVVKALQIARDGDDCARPPVGYWPASWPS